MFAFLGSAPVLLPAFLLKWSDFHVQGDRAGAPDAVGRRGPSRPCLFAHRRAGDDLTAIAVGTTLTGGPPHRSQRAELPHWAPASGAGVESHLGKRMLRMGGW